MLATGVTSVTCMCQYTCLWMCPRILSIPVCGGGRRRRRRRRGFRDSGRSTPTGLHRYVTPLVYGTHNKYTTNK